VKRQVRIVIAQEGPDDGHARFTVFFTNAQGLSPNADVRVPRKPCEPIESSAWNHAFRHVEGIAALL
jgi:hypothetical protein